MLVLVGRHEEKSILEHALHDDRSHFIAVYGRRRVGKTYLIRRSFNGQFTFQHAGIYGGSLREQLFAFESSLRDAGFEPTRKSRNWAEAFEELKGLIRRSTESRKVIFIDELSWMDTRNSDLMRTLESFWNGWASAREDVVLIVCASATSWMISKVVHNKGGLYHRLTDQIHLQPFTLAECQDYLSSRKLAMTRAQIVQCYMVFGGVPYYWDQLQRGMSLAQNIDRLLFSHDAPLRDEFTYLYASVYRNPTVHIKIIEALGTKKIGMTRDEIISTAKVENSGDLSRKLEELESCGFVRKYRAPGKKKKGAIYQLVDFFTLFHFAFLQKEPTDEHFWTNQINTPTVNAWAGLAFERVCTAHTSQIKSALGIAGVLSEEFPWQCKADDEKGYLGSQVDLAIARKDSVVTMCEIKYSEYEYAINADLAASIASKAHDLGIAMGGKQAIMPVLITMQGIIDNKYSSAVASVITADALFR